MFARIGVMRALNRRVERVFELAAEGQALGTPEAGAGSMTKAGGYRGIDPDGVAETEADHFGSCPICGALLDMRDLTQDGEGPEPRETVRFYDKVGVSQSDARRPVALPAVRSAELRPSGLVADRPSHPPLTVPSLA